MASNALIWHPFAEYAKQATNEPPESIAAAASVISPDPGLKPEKSTRFWNWLADGSWAGEEARPGRVADQESPA
jgi:hypothetical protein